MATDNRKRDMQKKRNYMHAYNARPHQKKVRAARNQARREAIRKGDAAKGDGNDVHHSPPFAKGGGRSSKTTVVPRGKNRAHKLAVRKG